MHNCSYFNSKQLKGSRWNPTVLDKSTLVPGDITGNHDNVNTGSGGLTPEKKNQLDFVWTSLNSSISPKWTGSAIKVSPHLSNLLTLDAYRISQQAKTSFAMI